LVGDWAVSIWSPETQELTLAVDYVACRHLFYWLQSRTVWWSTHLAPLVLLSRNRFHLDHEYVSGYLAGEPDTHETPYREIRQVPGGHFVRIRNGVAGIERYWHFGQQQPLLRYKSDEEYEEHFRQVFRQAVRRRLRTDTPVLAELSGGLDSSSIVCMADGVLRSEGQSLTPRLGTLSYYDTTEANGDDFEYLRKVEAARGQPGEHIDTATLRQSTDGFAPPDFSALPGPLGTMQKLERERAATVRNQGYRVTLSGLGGDELMGGIPDPSPELGDLLMRGRWFLLGKQLLAWSLEKRRPWPQLLWRAGTDLFPDGLRQLLTDRAKPDVWICANFGRRTRWPRPVVVPGACRPAWRYYTYGVLGLARKLAKQASPKLALEEVRYPYLDQTLVEFVLRLPPGQLLRPGERRSLMRRSLRGIVPHEILSRRTKQFAERTPLAIMEKNWPELRRAFESSETARFGFIDESRFLAELEEARRGKPIHIVRVMKTIALEFWLKDLAKRGILAESGNNSPSDPSLIRTREVDDFPSTSASKVAGKRSKKGGEHDEL